MYLPGCDCGACCDDSTCCVHGEFCDLRQGAVDIDLAGVCADCGAAVGEVCGVGCPAA